MSLAWKIFKNEKNDVTFSEALKFAWFAEKEFRGRNKKDLAFMSVSAISVKGLVEETDKAVKLEIVTPYGVSAKWYPKSVIA